MNGESKLPEGWIETTVGNISKSIEYGYTTSAILSQKGPRFLRITDIQNGKVDWDNVPGCEIDDINIAKYRLSPGDILFARTGATTGKSYLIRSCPDAIFASYLIRVCPDNLIYPNYLSLFFQTDDYWIQISDNLSGNAQPNCNASKLKSIKLPLPPLSEQRRIVAAVEALLDRVNASRERLDRMPGLLKAFRQAVLAAACCGRLTEGWRGECKESGNWQNIQIDDIAEKVIDYRGRTPPVVKEHGIPHITTTNIRKGSINWITEKFVTEDTYRAYMTRGIPEPGDVFFTMEGPLGEVAILHEDRKFSVAQRILIIRGKKELICGDYLGFALMSPDVQAAINSIATGSGVKGVAYKRLKYAELPVPPLSEQHVIVRRVESLFALADCIEQRVATGKERADRLTQAILAKAFRGELVATEAELARREGRGYEPAGVLLERIRRERSSETIPKTRCGKGKSGVEN